MKDGARQGELKSGNGGEVVNAKNKSETRGHTVVVKA